MEQQNFTEFHIEKKSPGHRRHLQWAEGVYPINIQN